MRALSMVLLAVLPMGGQVRHLGAGEDDPEQRLAQARNQAILAVGFTSRGVVQLAVTARRLPRIQRLSEAFRKVLGCPIAGERVLGRDGAWRWTGACAGLLRQRGLFFDGMLRLGGINEALHHLGIDDVTINVTIPKLGLRLDTEVAGKDTPGGWHRYERPTEFVYAYRTTYQYSPPPPDIDLAFGFQEADQATTLTAIVLVVGLPFALALILRDIAAEGMSGQQPDRVYGAEAAYSWLVSGVWLVWIGVSSAVHLQTMAIFLADPSAWAAGLLGTALFVAPPLGGILLANTVMVPVLARWHGRAGSLAAVVEASAGEGFKILRWFLILNAASAAVAGELTASAGLAGGAGVLFLIPFVWRITRGATARPLAAGPRRDQVETLAAKAQIHLREILVLPAGGPHGANAFAITGGYVVFTEELLELLDDRQFAAVVAHELGHLKAKHRSPQGMSVLYALVFGVLYAGAMSMTGLGNTWLRFVPVHLAAASWLAASLSRFREQEADAYALSLTGDPEAVIGALTRITRKANLPYRWNTWREAFLTHPSLLRRALLVGEQSGLSPEQVLALIEPPQPVPA